MMEVSPRNWADEILDWYRGGDFDVEVAAKLEIPLKEFHQKMQDNATFARLIDYGRTLCQAYWVGQAKKNLNNKSFNSMPWAFVMKNQFNWADKTEQVGTSDMPSRTLDELRQEVEKEVRKFKKLHAPELSGTITDLKAVQNV